MFDKPNRARGSQSRVDFGTSLLQILNDTIHSQIHDFFNHEHRQHQSSKQS